MINRYELVSRHNPVLKSIDYESPISVGNGDFAYTADVTGMQTLYAEYKKHNAPLCTMSQQGFHTTPVSETRYSYSADDLLMTEYNCAGRKVTYAVDKKKGNEKVYEWLRHNPHRFNLARIGFVWDGEQIESHDILNVCQELKLYEGIIESRFNLHGSACEVITSCDSEKNALAFQINSNALLHGKLKVMLSFPYGYHDITGSDWDNEAKHITNVVRHTENILVLKRTLDKESYYVTVNSKDAAKFTQTACHTFEIGVKTDTLSFTVNFSEVFNEQLLNTVQIIESSRKAFKEFWDNCGIVDLHNSKDRRANELERRIVLSQYLLAIQSCGSVPPPETGLTCNSWYGKFHLEMHPWHSAYLPLWNCSKMLEKSLPWYCKHLRQAKANAARNGYSGARWPKMTAIDAIDSPSTIATLLIWQQPHIIYMLELMYKSSLDEVFLKKYWEVVKETADFMCDLVVYNKKTKKYDLIPPVIPAQEEHDPMHTINPTFEVEYWRFTLKIAINWAKRINCSYHVWENISDNMADLPQKDNVYLAHENCPDTFEKYNKDHPSMLLAYGFIPCDRVNKEFMKNTLKKVIDCWDFSTVWGWDFALMAMTAVRLGDPDTAVDILLKNTPKNSYVASGNNFQRLRTDLPLYLPGNGSLLLAVSLMLAGYDGCKEKQPGFPKDGMWEIEFENISPFPY